VSTPPGEIDPRAAAASAADGSALLLDVREDDEWAAGHIAGAQHIPLSRIDLAAVPSDRPVIAVCRSGNRSGRVAAALAGAGIEVSNLVGGMLAWHEAGLPVVQDGGAPGFVK